MSLVTSHMLTGAMFTYWKNTSNLLCSYFVEYKENTTLRSDKELCETIGTSFLGGGSTYRR